ncbi:MAG: LLM class flavin-dependent oxidoreductase [Actinomycetota bacterium]
MRTGVFVFGGVEMPDAGAGPPASTDRRSGAKEAWAATERIIDTAVLCDRLGIDSFWPTEHHFQYEGYEVIPNGILLNTIIAERTEQLRLGTMFNVLGQWHPLRLAEDFSTLHNISGGRAILGVARGTVPRESENLGSKVGSFDNPDMAAADDFNRAQFAEALDVIRLALDNESFAYHGDVYEFPVPGIPDRGGTVQELSLVPRPLYPYEMWQAVTSPPTLEAVPRAGVGGVFWLKHHTFTKQFWDRYAEIHDETFGGSLAPGAKRTLVLNVCIGDTHEDAMHTVRAGHDEFWKFLGPYGWSRGYMGADRRPAPPGLIPTLEESLENRTWVVGTADHVAEQIDRYRAELGGLHDLVVFPAMPGDRYDAVDEQIERLATDVLPQLA